jgi:hypothetical protein
MIPLVPVLVAAVSLIILFFVFGKKPVAISKGYYDDTITVNIRPPGQKANQLAVARTLYALRNKLVKFTQEAKVQFPDNVFVKQIHKNWDQKLSELSYANDTIAVSKRKTSISICVMSESGEIADINALTYAAIHELAHVGIAEYNGHDQKFWRVMRQLLEMAEVLGYYRYSEQQTVCQRKLGQNILGCVKAGSCPSQI